MIRFLIVVSIISLTFSGKLVSQKLTVPQQQVDTEREYIKANQLKLVGKIDEALKVFEDITRKNRRNHAAYYEIARIYESKGDWLNAEKAIANAVRIDPNEPWYFVKQVDIFEGQGKLDAAAKVFDQLIPLRPDQQALYMRWAQILSNSGKWEEAIQVLNKEEKAFGKNLEITEAKVMIYKKAGNNEAIIAEWQKLHEGFPGKKEYLKRQVDELVKMGRFDELEPLYKKILEIDPNDADTKVKLARINTKNLSRLEQLNALEVMFEDATIPAEKKVRAMLPFIESLAIDFDSLFAASLLDKSKKLTDQYPHSAMAYALLADVYNQTGDMKNAAESYARTVAIDVSNAVVWEQYLFALSETQQYEKLMTASEDAMDLFPNRAEFFLLHGTAQMASGNWEDAINFSDQALIRAGRNTFIKLLAQVQIARSFHMKGDNEKRNSSVQKAITMDNRFLPAIKLYLGYSALKNSFSNEWNTMLSESMNDHPSDQTLRLFKAMSEKSTEEILTFTENDLPEGCLADGRCLEWMALWFDANEKRSAADFWWNKAASTDNFGPETYFQMKEIKKKQNN